MNAYLTIMVTVLVITQVIRIAQNQISLRRTEKAVKRDLDWINEREITKEDFEVQREAFYLLRDYLKQQKLNNNLFNVSDVVEAMIEAGQKDFKWGETIKYTPSQVADILNEREKENENEN